VVRTESVLICWFVNMSDMNAAHRHAVTLSKRQTGSSNSEMVLAELPPNFHTCTHCDYTFPDLQYDTIGPDAQKK